MSLQKLMDHRDPVLFWQSFSPADRERLRVLDPKRFAEALRAHNAEMGRRSFWFFVSEILRNPVLYEPFHHPLCEWAQDWTKSNKLLLAARGHVKSNLFTISHSLWERVKNPNIRILIASHSTKDSGKFLRGIRQIMESHDNFKAHYPDVVPHKNIQGKRSLWNNYQLLTDRTEIFTEATFESCSIGSEVTGRHYNIIYFDDMVTKENRGQPEIVKDFHELCESLLVGRGREFVIGTRYASDDEYGRIIDTEEVAEQYDIKVVPCLKTPEILDTYIAGKRWQPGDDEKYLQYPTHFTLKSKSFIDANGHEKKSIISIRAKQGPTTFANQYMLQPFDPKDATFREDDIIITHDMPDPESLKYYRCCDLSSEMHTGDSYTAIVTAAVDDRCNIYVTDIEWGDLTSREIVENLIDGQLVSPVFRPRYVSFEPGPWERAIKPWLERRMREREVFVPIYFTSGIQHAKSKDQRIMGLEPFVTARKLFVMHDCRHKDLLIEELVKFPAFVRRDIIDALAQIPVIALPGNWEKFIDSPSTRKNKVDNKTQNVETTEKTGTTFMDAVHSLSKRHTNTLGNDRVMRGGIRFARYGSSR